MPSNDTASAKQSNGGMDKNPIKLLPKDVVDQIAAGEVIHRPVNVVKELLENSIDAGATSVAVSLERGGLGKIRLSDNGKGMSKADLELAAVRHATSKLQSAEDLQNGISSLGFRGEALASVATVARLSILSRPTKGSPVGYLVEYNMGKLSSIRPTARQVGTTVTVSDLFFNLKHRQHQRPADEYQRILKVLQHYSILYASRGISISCEKLTKNKSVTDWNTSSAVSPLRSSRNPQELPELQQKATKQVCSQILGTDIVNQMDFFNCALQDEKDSVDGSENNLLGQASSEASYSLESLVSRTSLVHTKRTILILFVNDRLVESLALNKAIEDAFRDFTKVKPIAVLQLKVPAHHVDVNMHPAKTQVALLYQDSIFEHIASALKKHWQQQGQTFQSLSQKKPLENPYAPKKKQANLPGSGVITKEKQTASSKPNKPVPSSQKIRTSRSVPVGAMDRFFATQATHAAQSSLDEEVVSSQSIPAQLSKSAVPVTVAPTKHSSDCPLANSKGLDLTEPGAFAAVARRCTCAETNVVRLPPTVTPNLKRVIPTVCHYKSIRALRKRIEQQADTEFTQKLRQSVYCGAVSRDESLIQCQEELMLINHSLLARQLFYQLSLYHFGGTSTADLKDAVEIAVLISHGLQLEEDLREAVKTKGLLDSEPSETNQALANQAATCLFDNAEMLLEYFGLKIGKAKGTVMLQGMPVLLEGHEPPIHALPIFLLRLATEVDWAEEKPCFHGVATELANYYSQLPTKNFEFYAQHVIFPAISSLASVSKAAAGEGYVKCLTKLNLLYRVFERC